MNGDIAIDIFAGAGGISEGLRMAGFKVKYANEWNDRAAETYVFNHPETKLDRRDIQDVRADEILEAVGSKIKLVAGGPPCQGFSTLRKRDYKDSRNMLVWEFIRIVKGVRPHYFVMENVPGILSIARGKLRDDIIEAFEEAGYHTSFAILNAADFGVPQSRRRVFFFGMRKGRKDISKAKFKKSAQVTVRDAISDLDFLGNGGSSTAYKLEPETAYQKKMRGKMMALFNHEATRHNEKVIHRFSKMKPGQNITALPDALQINKNIMFRLTADRPARTVTSLPDDYVHYASNRILTVREVARLQSFKDSYVFLNRRTTGGPSRRGDCPQYTQVANAVPPLLMEGVGKWILK